MPKTAEECKDRMLEVNQAIKLVSRRFSLLLPFLPIPI